MIPRKGPKGRGNEITTSLPFTTTAFSRAAKSSVTVPEEFRVEGTPAIGSSRRAEGPPARSVIMKRRSEYRTSSGVTSEPSWNLTPLRIGKR